MNIVSQIVANSLVAGGGYGLVAVSLTLIYSTTRFFHFAHGAVYAAAAYISFSVMILCNADIVVALIAGAIGAGLLGGMLELFVYRPLRARFGSPTILLLASLGLLITLQNCISIVYGDDSKSMPTIIANEGLDILSARVTSIQLVSVLVSFVLFLTVAACLRFTKAGKVLRAVASNEELARIVGVNSGNVILLAFVFGSALAGVSATLTACDTGLRPMMGFNALLMGVVGMVIGGVGNASGAFLGGVLIGLAQQLGALALPSKWQDAIVFLILLLFLLFRPQGFFGKPLRTARV